MLSRLLFLFVVVPLIELYLLLEINEYTGIYFTFGLIIVTGFVGASLARWQGFQTWQRIQRELAQGRPPAEAMLHGLFILIAGAFLITPGVLTDLLGFSLLLPPMRSWMARRALRRMATKMQQGNFQQQPGGGAYWTFTSGNMNPPSPPHDEIIDTVIVEAGQGNDEPKAIDDQS